MNKKAKKARASFIALNPYETTVIVSPDESPAQGSDYTKWGDDNRFPQYIASLYDSIPTLASVINGCVDYASGNNVTTTRPLQGGKMNREGESIRDIVRQIAFNKFLFGGFALEVIRTADGSDIAEIYVVPMQYIRTTRDAQTFIYSEEWDKRFGGSITTRVYEKFDPAHRAPSSILYVKNIRTKAYPRPLYMAAITSCETERKINVYHLNAITNGFSGSYIVNFNNGDPMNDDIKEAIEREFNKKFAGETNAGRLVVAFNSDKEHAVSLERMDATDFGEKYEALAKRSVSQIFTSFRANPNLFGMPTEANGFNSEEYESSFKLFNKTMIQPVQQEIVEALERVLGSDTVTIEPFSLASETKEV